MTGFLRFKRKEEIAVASEIKRRFTDTEMQIVRETDLLELLTHLGYQVKRIGRYHTTAEMDSLRIKDRRTWFRYSQNTGGDAITLVQQFCDKTFPEAVEYLLTFNGRARDSPAKAVPSVKRDEVQKPFILIPDAPGKYYLSSAQVEKLLYKSSEGRKAPVSMTQTE